VLGQHVTDLATEYQEQVAGLAAATGSWPALLCTQIESPRAPLQVAAATALVRDYWQAGGLVLLKWAMWNPYTGRGMNDRPPPGQPDPVDLPGLIEPERARDPAASRQARQRLDGWLDEVAAGLGALQRDGVAVLWRPCSEMNGGWFWWGRRPRQDYIAWWRFLYHELTVRRGLHNLIWVFESDSGVHTAVPVDYYYPGDDVVDVFGHNIYHDTWRLPFDADAISRRYPKVYAIPQAGPGDQRDGSWDNRTYLRAAQDWLPRCSFIGAWNTFVGPVRASQRTEPVATGRGRHHLALLHNAHAAELLADPAAVTRERLPRFGAAAAAPPRPPE